MTRRRLLLNQRAFDLEALDRYGRDIDRKISRRLVTDLDTPKWQRRKRDSDHFSCLQVNFEMLKTAVGSDVQRRKQTRVAVNRNDFGAIRGLKMNKNPQPGS